MLYKTSILTVVWDVFRMIEYAMCSEECLSNNEWSTYTFDGAFMLVVVACFYIWYPSQIQVENSSLVEPTDSPDLALALLQTVY
jgi:hypothetical protein